MKKNRLFIFDFDGTIVDSEPNYDKSKDLHCKELAITISPEASQKFVGIGTTNAMQMIKEQYGLSQSVEELVKRADELYIQIARQSTPVFTEVKKFIIELDRLGYPMVVASGTSLALLHELLDQIKLKHYFKAIYSAEQVEHGKPAPDLFLYAAKEMGFAPTDCIVLEDSAPGVLAAKSAGMPCLAMPMEECFTQAVFHDYPLYTFASGHHFSSKAMLSALENDLI